MGLSRQRALRTGISIGALRNFLTKQVQVGLVGYVYNQITPDRLRPSAVSVRVAGALCRPPVRLYLPAEQGLAGLRQLEGLRRVRSRQPSRRPMQ